MTETCLTKAITIIALSCFLLGGVAVTSILSRETMQADAATPAPVVKDPVANRTAKADRLTIVGFALAAIEPPQQTPEMSEQLRQAYASSSPADIEAAKAVAALPQVASPQASSPQASSPQASSPQAISPQVASPTPQVASPTKPKAAAVAPKPQPQKSYALLSDAQIATIKDRLKLSSSQESYWPAVETALRQVARKIHATRQANPNATGAPQIDPDSEEVQQLKSAAMPLLFQLREDQKDEVRKLARIIGLDKVASAI
jgi:hypothetical protein